MPGSGDSIVELEDIISLPKTGSVKAISRFIAMRGIVTRRELRERFQSGSTRTTITHLKKLGLVYSRQGRNGFVVSIPWLLYLNEIGADWKSIVKAKVPDVNEKELSELEKALREAKRGPLGAFVRQLVRERPLIELQEEQIERIIGTIPRECSYPSPGQWRSVEEYYVECVRPLLGYIQWLLSLVPLVASYLRLHPSERLKELVENLAEQARELAKGTTSADWEIRLYARTLYVIAKLLSRLDKLDTKELNAGKALQEHFEKVLAGLRDDERYNKNTVLKPFIGATVAKILTGTPAPTL